MCNVYLPDGEQYEPNLTPKQKEEKDSIIWILKTIFPDMIVQEDINGNYYLLVGT